MKGVKNEKIISSIMCIVLILTLCSSALASNKQTDNSIASGMYSNSTAFSTVKMSDNGDYALIYNENNEDMYIPVGRLDVTLSDDDAVKDVLEKNNLSNEVKEYIKELADKAAVEPENADLHATIFSPDLLPKTRATVYYTYLGMEMKSEQVYTYNISTGYHYIETGVAALAAAKSVNQILLYAAGNKIGAISLGATLLSIFQNAVGGNVYVSSAEDFTQIQLRYDGIKQWTYGKAQGDTWYLGYCSQRVTVKEVDLYQQFVVNGKGTQSTKTISENTTVKSNDFDSPWKTAYYNLLNPIDEWVSYSVYGTTWYFD